MDIIFTLAGKKHDVTGTDLQAKLAAVKALGLADTSWSIEATSEELEKLLGVVSKPSRSSGGGQRQSRGQIWSKLTAEKQAELVAGFKKLKGKTSIKDFLKEQNVDARGGVTKHFA